MADNPVVKLITQMARQRNLDPHAVIAVGLQEGLGHTGDHATGGGIGDGGTSFGPFQLHFGGAYPRFAPQDQAGAQRWAWSKEGIGYALDQIAKVAAGQSGQAAVNSIVRRFERPANPGLEVSNALKAYGTVPQGGGSLAPSGGGVGGGSLLPEPASSLAGQSYNSLAAAALLDMSQRTLQGQGPDPSSLIGLMLARQTMGAASQQYGPEPSADTAVTGGKSAGGNGTGKGIAEAFYDPLGSYDSGHFGGPIGGHSDHVHLSFGDPQTALQAIAAAKKLGLAVRENPYVDPVDPVHVNGSFHYKTFAGLFNGRHLGEAIDASGNPSAMAALFRMFTPAKK